MKYFLLIILLFTSLQASAGYNNAICKQKLQEQGFAPACSSQPCVNILGGMQNHMACSTRSLYSPTQAVECYNSKTRKAKFFPANEIFNKCNALAQKDPSWTIKMCYCCCP